MIAAGFVALLILLGVVRVKSARAARDMAFQSVFLDRMTDSMSGHFLIYLDIEACLACTEDMGAWIELERNLPQCGCTFSIYAPFSNSFDVAYAMELEGLNTPVRVLDESDLLTLRWADMRTPIKVLLDSTARPVNIKGAMGNRMESKNYAGYILSEICGEN